MKILHLYHDLMNLYGDYANISALCRIFEKNEIGYTLDKMSLGDEPDFTEYDFVFVGSGSEENQKLALEHLKEYKEGLSGYIEKGGVALFTGNSFEMLGEKIESFLGEFEGLGLLSFKTVEQRTTRNTADAVFLFENAANPLVGFINKCSAIEGVETPLFRVEMGLGNSKEDNREGVRYKNFFGTHLTGPVLVKNPHFLKMLASLVAGKELNTEAFHYETAGYNITLEKLRSR